MSPDSPAARAGIKTGDLIVSIDGASVEDPNAFGYRFATKPIGGSAQIGLVRQGRATIVSIALQALPDQPRQELEIRTRSPFLGVTVANLSPALADELRLDPQAEGVVITDVADGSVAQSFGFQKGDIVASVNDQRSANLPILSGPCFRGPSASSRHHARRPEDRGDILGMTMLSPRQPKPGEMPERAEAALWGLGYDARPHAAGLDRDAPRPLADRLRPTTLAEVVGQDQLLGPDGALTRMLETRSLGSLIFWGPPGTGKTTVARLLAHATELYFEQISAIFSGVADLKKVFDAARLRRETGQGTLLFVDEIHRFNRAQQDSSCR